MKRMLFLAFVASTLFSCNKQDLTDTENLMGENSVTLSIKQVVPTRGVSDQIGGVEYAVIGSARIYFIDAANASIYQRDLTAAEITALKNTTTTPGGNTVTISGVPNTATSLYFMANIKTSAGSAFPQVDGLTSADARLRIDKLQVLAENAPMSGHSGPFVQGTGNAFTASVAISPIVARVELGSITCQNQGGSSSAAIPTDITGYKLSGVFVNHIYPSVLLSGIPYSGESLVDIKAQAGWTIGFNNYFNASNTAFPYYVGGVPAAPTDWVENSMVTFCTPAAAGLSFYPDKTIGSTSTAPTATPVSAWGYQIVPSTAGATVMDVPHIILKLTDVTYSEANPLNNPTQYITVTKYKDDSGAVISEFKRGNVYRIQNLLFTHNEATNQPYEKNISVTATVTVVPWVVNNVNPDWN
ncbi:MAG: hypothetical protein RRY72_00460 [Bacteroides sp.]